MSSLFMDMLDAYEEIADAHGNRELKDMVAKMRADRGKNTANKRSSWYKKVDGVVQEIDPNADIRYLKEDLEDYKLTYYLSTATAERRPETIEDVENDWKEETFAADSDYDALLHALELIDNGYDDTDFSTAEEIVNYFDEKDLGDGSAFVVKLEGPNGVIYDMGQTKDDFIEQVKENDDMLAYYRKVLGIDESLNEDLNKEFVELEAFKNSWKDLKLTEEDLRDLQNEILTQRNKWIPLGSDVYKIYFAPKSWNKGSRESLRAIYIELIRKDQIYLAYAFNKADDANITNKELNLFRIIANSMSKEEKKR